VGSFSGTEFLLFVLNLAQTFRESHDGLFDWTQLFQLGNIGVYKITDRDVE